MHPVNKKIYGQTGINVRYYNGSTVTNGYVVKQTGTISYNVTDGTNPKSVTLAQTAAQVSALGSTQPTIATIPLSGTVTASGATFTPTFALDSATVKTGGFGYSTNDILAVTGGVRATGTITIGTVVAGNTITVNGTAITVVASGASGPQVNVGTAAAVGAALYTYLSVSVNTQINYAQNGAGVVTLIAQTTGTGGNAYTLATNAPSNFVISGATLSGGAADTAGTASAVTVASVAGSAIATVTVSTPGAWTTLPSGPIYGYSASNGRTPALLTVKYNVASIASSGGTGYAVNDALSFVGGSDTQTPTAHISVASSGAATTTVVDYVGSGITAAPSSIGVLGVVEHAKSMYDATVRTVEGNRYSWNMGTSVNGSAVVAKYS